MKSIFIFTIISLNSLAPSFGGTRSLEFMGNANKSAVVIQTFKQGNPLGTGTAFQVKYSSSSSGNEYNFLVTAGHVIQGADTIRILFNRNLNEADRYFGKERVVGLGASLYLNQTKKWELSDGNSDIAVIFLNSETRGAVSSRGKRSEEYLASKSTSSDENVWIENPAVLVPDNIAPGISDEELPDIFYSGYPVGLHGNNWLQALTRRCTVAIGSTNGLPIGDHADDDFLIDCAPIEGDSGSPVFMRTVKFNDFGQLLYIKTELVGVLGAYVSWDEVSSSKTRDLEVQIKRKNSLGFGRVAPASHIVPTIQKFLSRWENQP